MFRFDKSYGMLLAVLAGLAFFPLDLPSSFSIDTAKDPRFAAVPLTVGEWRGTEDEVDDRTYEILETKNVLSRMYENPKGEKIHLLLVSSSEDRRVAHPPEVCYLSSNYAITNENEETMSIAGRELAVKKFVAQDEKDPAHHEEVLYVYKAGDRFTTNYYAHQFQFVMDRLRRRNSGVLLIRLSSPHQNSLRKFFSDFFPYFS